MSQSTSATVETVELGGIQIARITRAALVERLLEESCSGRGGWITTMNVDYFQRHASSPNSSVFQRADLIVADGMPLLWACKLKGTPLPDRVAGSDLVWLIAEGAARRSRSLYLLGGNSGVGEVAARTLRDRWPSLTVAGHSNPRISNPPTAAEIETLRDDLSRAKPDIVYVAFGAPKEELLIDALRVHFPRVWWIGVGISLSFIAGEVTRAPVWLQHIGLEWLHRLAQEPRRLGSRYLTRNLPFTAGLLARSAWAGLRR